MIETTNWGNVNWYDDDIKNGPKSMSVGLVTVNQGAHQTKHIHYDEQVLYIVSGDATMYVDDEEIEVAPGLTYHWNAGVTHEVLCRGTEPFRHIIVSSSVTSTEELLDMPGDEAAKNHDEAQLSEWLYKAVKAIPLQFLENLHYKYAVFDLRGNVVTKSRFQSGFCVQCCNAQDGTCMTPCMAAVNSSEIEQEVTCPYGMTIFQMPIYYNHQLMGYIQGGYIRMSGDMGEQDWKVYESTRSAAAGIRSLLKKIAKVIINSCEIESFHQELSEREMKIASAAQHEQLLQKNLREAEYTMTDLRINNHFLFNTLNSMASLALQNSNRALYQSIIDLSRLFRYTIQYTGNIVEIKKEYEYLRAYLELQKLRYKDKLQIIYDIDHQLETTLVPYNILQPIAENAFKHGFIGDDKKVIKIHINKLHNHVDILIGNSGKHMDKSEVFQANQRMKSNSFHGMSMIYHKLCGVYGDNFKLEILSNAEKGTRIHMELPLALTSERGRQTYD